MEAERRREKNCPSCGGGDITRGGQIPGMLIVVKPMDESDPGVTTYAYSDICRKCGMVMIYTRR